MGQIHKGRASYFGALVADLTDDEFLMLGEAVDEMRCREWEGVGTLADAAEAYWTERECPGCGARGGWMDGSTAAGVPRWLCRCCSRRFNSLTGTVLEHCRKPLPTWVSFIRLMRHYVPVECAAELCGVTHKTAFEWRHRVLATVSGYQDRIVLRDTVWVDETYINETDLSKGYGQARKRGLSRQMLCICVAIDVHEIPVAFVFNHGKPSSARVRNILNGRIAPAALLIHDLERAHNALIRADLNDPVCLEGMSW